jgi:hypothetical protein
LKFLDPSWVFPTVAILGLAWFVHSRWKSFGRIQKLAKEMGITFSTGGDECLALFHKQNAPVQNQEPSGVAWVLGLFSNWRLEGKIDGVPIRVHQTKERQAGSDDKYLQYTMLNAMFDPALSLGLSVERRQGSSPSGRLDKLTTGLMEKIAANFVERSDRAEVSRINEGLEQKLAIKTHSPEAARTLFADAAVQDQVLRAMELPGHVTIDDHGVRLIRGKNFDDPEALRSAINVLCATAGRLQPRSSA